MQFVIHLNYYLKDNVLINNNNNIVNYAIIAVKNNKCKSAILY